MSTNYATIKGFPDKDKDWSEEQWKYLIEYLVDNDMVKYKELISKATNRKKLVAFCLLMEYLLNRYRL